MHAFGAATNIGNQRENNEDSFVVDERSNLWIVADGMGGLGFGEVASAITVYTITTMLKEGHGIHQAIEISHKRIKEYAEAEGSGTNMGTTVVLLYSQASLYNIFWVGDSRAYMFDGALSQLTHDHSLVQTLVDQGELSREEAAEDPRKSAITRALGVQELDIVRAESISEKWKRNQKILLCSDGLSDCVADEDIEKILQEATSEQQAVDNLIDKALAEGGKDNITAILVAAPDAISHEGSDTEIPLDDTAGWRDQGREQGQTDAMADTHVMNQHIPSSDAINYATEKNKKDIPILSMVAASSDAESHTHSQLDSEMNEVSPDVVRGNLLSDRYLIPLGLVLAVLLVWIMMPGRSSLDVTDSTEKPALPEFNDSGDAVAGKAVKPETSGETGIQPVTAMLKVDEGTDNISRKPTATTEASADSAQSQIDEVQDSELLVYQLGVYTKLSSAEQIQQDLTRFGLYAHIDKRANGNGIRYSVILGPYPDQDENEKVVSTLQRENVSYYARTPAKNL